MARLSGLPIFASASGKPPEAVPGPSNAVFLLRPDDLSKFLERFKEISGSNPDNYRVSLRTVERQFGSSSIDCIALEVRDMNFTNDQFERFMDTKYTPMLGAYSVLSNGEVAVYGNTRTLTRQEIEAEVRLEPG